MSVPLMTWINAAEQFDGRDREGAEIIDKYPKGDRDARRAKEQQAINDRGGVDNLITGAMK